MSLPDIRPSDATRVLVRIVYRGSTPRLRQRLVVDGGVLGGVRCRSSHPYDPTLSHVERVLGACSTWAQQHGERALRADGHERAVGAVRVGVLTGSRPDGHYLLVEIEPKEISE